MNWNLLLMILAGILAANALLFGVLAVVHLIEQRKERKHGKR